ncbi:MAG: carbohydrate-binding module family 20 domain-containing protein [Rhodothermales bacterium]
MKSLFTIAVLALACIACEPADRPTAQASLPPITIDPATDATPGTFVHLFEWRWDDIAQECEAFLGPKGYTGVQVSPPLEHARVDGSPWWDRYQPASYDINTRSGDRAAFADMVQRCDAVGVGVYVDAILNHMTGAERRESITGRRFGAYDYPGLYSYEDFHHCGLTDGDEINNWNDRTQVRTCELVNLADLATGKENVRDTLAAYLDDLASLGVAGIRIDAARHMAPEDIAAILDRMEGTLEVFQEVIDPAPPTWSEEYYPMGRVTEFQFSSVLSDVFYNGPLARLHGDGSIWETVPFIPGDEALVFIDNHDNQRGHGAGGHIVMHNDGALHTLAMGFMLAYPYGQPRVMSSYRFEDDAQGPPRLADGSTKPVHAGDALNCAQGEWVCEHRQPEVAGMVDFRRVTHGAPVAAWWTDGDNQIAFAREARGFVALNRSDATMTQMLPTTLPAGTYCDVTQGGLIEGACGGRSVTINAEGEAAIDLEPMTMLGLHVDARLAD